MQMGLLNMILMADAYMFNAHYVVFTGGPGAGKTTVLNLLKQEGMNVIEESGRKIIKAQLETGGHALPWKDRQRYSQLMADDSSEAYKNASACLGVTLFDCGIPDTLGYCNLEGIPVSHSLIHACHEFRYNETVFLFPFWNEIYSNDAERKQDRKTAEATTAMMENVYSSLGYRIVKVPLFPPQARAAWIKESIKRIVK